MYPYYDLVVWSQTRHWWLEAKLTELGCLTDDRCELAICGRRNAALLCSSLVPPDKISFVLDRTPMFSITIQPNGQEKRKHQVKALEIIWKRFPHHFGPREYAASLLTRTSRANSTYAPDNTIHIDDLSRNFAMNPSCGLKSKTEVNIAR